MLRAARQSPKTVPPLPPDALRGLYAWLDRLPLSRPKRHLARDFSDGVMMAEIVKHFHPQLVDLHNYVPTCNTDQKLSNWSTLNRKVLHKLHFCVLEADIRKVVANTPGAVEPILWALRAKVEEGTLGGSPPSEAGPGRCSPGADGPWAKLTGRRCTAGICLGGKAQVGGASRALGSWKVASPPSYSLVPVSHRMGYRQPLPCSQDMGDLGVQKVLENKEQALAILQETVKILQMKVARLEQLVKLKDLRIRELAGHADKAQ
ncbi:sperm flagellar protein 1-like [Trichechus inunguis]